MKTLRLAYNQIGDEGGEAIGAALSDNSVLANLDLRCNKIGPEGVKALASALAVNQVLWTVR